MVWSPLKLQIPWFFTKAAAPRSKERFWHSAFCKGRPKAATYVWLRLTGHRWAWATWQILGGVLLGSEEESPESFERVPTVSDDLVEKSQSSVTIHDLDSLALTLLVDFSYTGEIVITEENVQVLLPASSILQMATVREACCKFLMRQLHPTNCLGIRSFAGTKRTLQFTLYCSMYVCQIVWIIEIIEMASDLLQILTPARNYTSDHTSLPYKTFKKSWAPKNFFSYPFRRWVNSKNYCIHCNTHVVLMQITLD